MKVDTSKIEGYEEMSDAEKVRALEAHEFEEKKQDTGELERLKAALDKATGEAAANKRALREKQSEEEVKAAAEAEEREKILLELEALKKEKVISSHKAAYLELGYDAKTAEDNAKALHAGDFATVFANQKKFIEEQKKAAASRAMDEQPTLTNGSPVGAQSAGDKLSADLRRFAGLPTK